jgi:signal peptidase I
VPPEPTEPTAPTALVDDPSRLNVVADPEDTHGDLSDTHAGTRARSGDAHNDGNGDGHVRPDDNDANPEAPEPAVSTAGARRNRWIREGVIVLVVALLVAIVLRTYVVQTFYIPTGSMEPTLQVGDRILVNKLSYHLHGIHRGDIVVFNRPKAEDCGGPAVNDLVKRVIGLPGETISAANGYIDINGKRLNESWLPASHQGITGEGPSGSASNLAVPYKIPTDNYYVMGDNRMDSCDSRFWGPVSGSLVVGKVELRVWPLTALHLF